LKLLFDQNLSRKLLPAIASRFPGSSHVVYLNLDTADDATIRRFAEAEGFTLVTKNTDMVDLCVVKGAPPKVLWLRVGNCATGLVADVLEANQERINRFEHSDQVVLSLFRLTPVD
jgi:predicted nuclease of predicted toxin-antitoxin system